MSAEKRQRKAMNDYATEVEWLRFFREAATTYLPNEDRVIEWMRAEFEKKTRKICPERA